jgi:hypothetical protein
MRFVSHSPGFTVEVVKEKTRHSNYGDRIVDQEQINARFNQDDVTDADIEFAESVWGLMPGRTVLIDEVTPSPALDRVSVYDTDEEAIRGDWEGRTVLNNRGEQVDLKEWVEGILSSRAERHPDFRQFKALPAQPPWPTYLQWNGTLEQLVQTLLHQGHDLRKVLAFEKQQGRPQVIAAIEQAIAERDRVLAEAEQIPA